MKLLFLLICGSAFAANPDTMTKMDVRITGSGIAPGSYSALPKLIYRAGPKYARMEDAPYSKASIHKLTIIAEPDAYSVDLMGRTGTHAIDQGGPNDLHLPMVMPLDPMHRMGVLDGLEFGNELEFFTDAGAIKSPGPIVNANPTDMYTLKVPGVQAVLITRAGANRPIFLTLKSKDGAYKYEYSMYQNVPFDPALFTRPTGVKFREIPPPGPDEHN